MTRAATRLRDPHRCRRQGCRGLIQLVRTPRGPWVELDAVPLEGGTLRNTPRYLIQHRAFPEATLLPRETDAIGPVYVRHDAVCPALPQGMFQALRARRLANTARLQVSTFGEGRERLVVVEEAPVGRRRRSA